MKKIFKILVFAGIFALSTTSLFAKEFDVAFNLGPSYRNVIFDEVNMLTVQNDFNITLLKVTDKEFVRKYEINLHYIPGHAFDTIGDNPGYGGFDFTFGFGKPIINSEKLTLTFTGIAGIIYTAGGGGLTDYSSYTNSNNSIYSLNADKIELHIGDGNSSPIWIEQSYGLFELRTGADLTGIYKFSKRFGAFVNLGFYYDLGGMSYTYKERYATKSDESSSDSWTARGWTVSPSFGICVLFGNKKNSRITYR